MCVCVYVCVCVRILCCCVWRNYCISLYSLLYRNSRYLFFRDLPKNIDPKRESLPLTVMLQLCKSTNHGASRNPSPASSLFVQGGCDLMNDSILTTMVWLLSLFHL